jgi:GTP-binding protein YchF
MKLAIIGKPQSGKTTIFEALTRAVGAPGNKTEARIGTISVPDERVDVLSRMYKPRKTIFAQVEYFLPAMHAAGPEKKSGEQAYWTQVRDSDALIHCLRNFDLFETAPPTPSADFQTLDQEMMLADLVSVEKRLERLALDQKRGKKPDPEEADLLQQCRAALEDERPLRCVPELATAFKLRGYAFLSAKPQLILFNNADEDDGLPPVDSTLDQASCVVLRGRLEQELSRMSPEEAAEFLSAFGVEEAAAARIVRRSYRLLGLISFFTVGDDEVRAWTIREGTTALDAAEVIHSDIKKGFIRAEVLAYADLMAATTFAEARKQGTVRLEGKQYAVRDGDIINFRFNV